MRRNRAEAASLAPQSNRNRPSAGGPFMNIRLAFAVGAVVLALFACSKKEAPASGDAARIEAVSPLDAPLKSKSAKAADIDALLALLPEIARPTHDVAKFDAKTGATVVGNLRFVLAKSDGAPSAVMTAKRAEFYGVNADAVQAVKKASALNDAPFLRLFEHARLFDVRFTGEDGGPMSIAAVELDGLSLREGALTAGARQKGPAPFFNAFQLGGLYLKEWTTQSSPGAQGEIAFKAPDLRLVGISGGKLGAFLAKDFEYEIKQSADVRAAIAKATGPLAMLFTGPLGGMLAPDEQRIVAKTIEWRGIDASGWLSYALKHEKPPLTAANLIDLGTVKAMKIDTFISGRQAAHSEEALVSAFKFTGLMPTKIRTQTKGDRYDFTAYMAPAEKAAIAVLKKHGLDKVTGKSQGSWDWDTAKGGASLAVTADTQGLADFDMRLDLDGLEAAKLEAASAAGEKDAVARIGALKSFSLKLADETLLDAMFDVSALEMGGTGEELRQSTPAMLRLAGTQAEALNPRLGAVAEAFADFVAEGGTLEISAVPPAPVKFEALAATMQAAPQAAPDLINLKATHTPNK
jgi:hypothetical protein